MKLAVVIITLNEEIHLARCLESTKELNAEVFVIDSFSSDRTKEIATNLGAKVLEHKFETHANQFNWGLTQLHDDIDWVIRLDADEYITPELVVEIQRKLPDLPLYITGLYCYRWVVFSGRLMRFAGLHNIMMLRVWRHGKGRCESRWMDEHIIVDGDTANLHGAIIDHNLKSLSYWIDKHNGYSSKEAVDLLNLKYKLFHAESIAKLNSMSGSKLKRWLKENIYARAPLGFRSFIFFLYRYFFLLGFLDGKAGFTFNFLQCFWYRFLVDAKLDEVLTYQRKHGVELREVIRIVLNIDLKRTDKR